MLGDFDISKSQLPLLTEWTRTNTCEKDFGGKLPSQRPIVLHKHQDVIWVFCPSAVGTFIGLVVLR